MGSVIVELCRVVVIGAGLVLALFGADYLLGPQGLGIFEVGSRYQPLGLTGAALLLAGGLSLILLGASYTMRLYQGKVEWAKSNFDEHQGLCLWVRLERRRIRFRIPARLVQDPLLRHIGKGDEVGFWCYGSPLISWLVGCRVLDIKRDRVEEEEH